MSFRIFISLCIVLSSCIPSFILGQIQAQNAQPQVQNGQQPQAQNAQQPQFQNAQQPQFQNAQQPQFQNAQQPQVQNAQQPQVQNAQQPQFQNAPQPQFQNAPQPQFQNAPQPQFQNAPQPQFQNAPQPQFQNAQQPQFQNAQQPQFKNAQPQFQNAQPQFQNAQQFQFQNAQQFQFQNAQPQFQNAQQPQFQNGQDQSDGTNNQFLSQQQSPWAGLNNLLSQIPVSSIVQLIMSLVQNSPFMYVMNSIFGKAFVTFQILSISYSLFAAISFFFPTTGQYLEQQIASITNALAPYSFSNLPNTLSNMQPVANAMNMMGINQPACQMRASCEAGQMLANNFPSAAQMINMIGNVMPIQDKFNQPFLRGTANVNCAAAFRSCPTSPIQNLFNLNGNQNFNENPRN